MRITVTPIVRPFVALAVLVSLATPSLAKKTEAKTPEISAATRADAASSCNASQMAADGTWTLVPCHEVGASAPAPQRTSAKSDGESPR